MIRLFALIMSMILAVSLGLGSAAHATEGVGGAEIPKSLAWEHVDNDGDQVPRDAEKNYPHHHASCHGDHVGVPVTPGPVALVCVARVAPLAVNQGAVTPASTDPALRPPQA